MQVDPVDAAVAVVKSGPEGHEGERAPDPSATASAPVPGVPLLETTTQQNPVIHLFTKKLEAFLHEEMLSKKQQKLGIAV